MWGKPAQWDPAQHLAQHHPDVRVHRRKLPGALMGCVDLRQRIIWLGIGLTDVQERCTLAFEIAQLEQGPTPDDPCMAAAYRRAAEEWAASMLLPSDRLIAGFSVSYRLDEIAAALEVDTPTLRARLRGLTDEEQDDVMDTIRGMSAVA